MTDELLCDCRLEWRDGELRHEPDCAVMRQRLIAKLRELGLLKMSEEREVN